VEQAQDALCPTYKTVEPDPVSAGVYQELFALYRGLYFGLGSKDAAAAAGISEVLPALRRIAAEVRKAS
jgi:L-ribulokinase